MPCVFVLTEEEEQRTTKWHKTESVFDRRLVVVNARPQMQLVGRGAPTAIPDYSQTEQTQHMCLLPVVQAGAMRPLTAEQALAAAASGTAIVRAQCERAGVPSGDLPQARALSSDEWVTT